MLLTQLRRVMEKRVARSGRELILLLQSPKAPLKNKRTKLLLQNSLHLIHSFHPLTNQKESMLYFFKAMLSLIQANFVKHIEYNAYDCLFFWYIKFIFAFQWWTEIDSAYFSMHSVFKKEQFDSVFTSQKCNYSTTTTTTICLY